MARTKLSKEKLAQWHNTVHCNPPMSLEQKLRANQESTPSLVARVWKSSTWVSCSMALKRHSLPLSRAQGKIGPARPKKDENVGNTPVQIPKIIVTAPDGKQCGLGDMPEWQKPRAPEEVLAMYAKWKSQDFLSPRVYARNPTPKRAVKRKRVVRPVGDSEQPSTQPSARPSARSSERPSQRSSERPSTQPSARPSARPSQRSSERPSQRYSERSSERSSERPSQRPSERPSQPPRGRKLWA
ncbi:hypothetical protein MGU_04750 [Metarhizium guizhouense ARSEF 977]|uniref:Uncharacterized protein n=1 Tax=Metarhizium guizhouense (strain ARSEF 977) TaxID=1276136 RepID=A0A0B4GMD3_METGA|nr:hypothetical protein MGU_04750 [Metarhizium guizhouense ARSEF 977]